MPSAFQDQLKPFLKIQIIWLVLMRLISFEEKYVNILVPINLFWIFFFLFLFEYLKQETKKLSEPDSEQRPQLLSKMFETLRENCCFVLQKCVAMLFMLKMWLTVFWEKGFVSF